MTFWKKLQRIAAVLFLALAAAVWVVATLSATDDADAPSNTGSAGHPPGGTKSGL